MDPTEITHVSTDYPKRPEHRGHTVAVLGWNEEYVMLVIRAKNRTHEALITPAQLRELADAAEREAPNW